MSQGFFSALLYIQHYNPRRVIQVQQQKQGIGLQVWPQILSTIKFLMAIPLYWLGSNENWIAFATLGLFAIWLDKADGDLARWIESHLGIPRWKHGPSYNDNTDIWQFAFMAPLFPRWVMVFMTTVAIVSWVLKKTLDDGEPGRFWLIVNSLGFMTYAYILVGEKLTHNDWIALPIVMVAFLMLYVTWDSWKKHVRGTL